jgi:glycosyltransferase involved in cell wall biosynthesis
MTGADRPAILVVFYANPDHYPPTRNAIVMLRERFRVHLVCRNDAGPALMTWPDDVRVERVGPAISERERAEGRASAKLREYLGFVRAVRRALAAGRPAVAFAYEPHALAALALAGCRAPIVYQRHELEIGSEVALPWTSMQTWILALARRIGRRAAVVVFPEKNRAEIYQRAVGDPRPAMIVPNFPMLSAFPAPSPWTEILEARRRTRQILYRGSIGSDNGVFEMVRAMGHLDAGFSLRLCGRAAPEVVREIEAVAASIGVAGRVRYDGVVPYERLNRETALAAVGLVLYQQRAGNNLVLNATATNKLYEYAACGVPVVAPDWPSYRDFFAGDAWVELADASDPAAVARAIERIFEDPGRYEERCRAARRAFEERFNYDAVFAPLLDRIAGLAGGA